MSIDELQKIADTWTPADWVFTCDGRACECGASNAHDCGCGADWTSSDTYLLRAAIINATLSLLCCYDIDGNPMSESDAFMHLSKVLPKTTP